MIDFYDFVDDCRQQGLTDREALAAFYRAQNEAAQDRREIYYDSPETCAGWHQGDIIDMYRRER